MGWLDWLMKKSLKPDAERSQRLHEAAQREIARSNRLANAAKRYAEREGPSSGQHYSGS